MSRKIVISLAAVGLLLSVYLFQDFHLLDRIVRLIGLPKPDDTTGFIIRKILRLIINDAACMMLIWVWFPGKSYLRIAWLVFLLEVLVLLPAYLIIKLNLEGPTELSSPLLSQFHRLLVNPLLMVLLMAGFVYQKIRLKSPKV